MYFILTFFVTLKLYPELNNLLGTSFLTMASSMVYHSNNILKSKAIIPSLYNKIKFVRDYGGNIISWKTMCDYIIYQTRLWTTKKFENGLITINKNYYTVTYYDGDNKYNIRFPKNRGIRQIIKVTSSGKDITKEILQFMGPSHNFHGINTSPQLLGYEDLIITYRNGTQFKYNNDDTIYLKPGNY
jgi:hypothetical protein